MGVSRNSKTGRRSPNLGLDKAESSPRKGEAGYTNALDPPQDRYQDYITHDLISDVEHKLSAAPGRANRAIVGLSMGGFGAVKIGCAVPTCSLLSAGGVPRSMFPAALFPSGAGHNPAILIRPSEPVGAKPAARTILSCWCARPIPRLRRTCFSPAASRRVFCRQVANSRPCWLNVTCDTSLKPCAEAMIGISGMRGSRLCLPASSDTFRPRTEPWRSSGLVGRHRGRVQHQS